MQGVGNKLDVLNYLVSQINPSAVVITEHHKSCNDLSFFNLSNFDIVSFYCRNKHKHGGVAIYCKTNLRNKITRVKWAYDYCLELDIELSIVKIEIDGLVIFLLGLYRSPTGNIDIFFENLGKIICKLSTKKPNVKIIILGDINIDTLKETSSSRQLRDFVVSHNYIDLFKSMPTRVCDLSKTSIDHVITNVDNIYSACIIDGHLSDHYGQLLVLNSNVPKHNPKRFKYERNFSEQNIFVFKYMLDKENWTDVYKIKEINEKWNVFLSKVEWCLNCSCPIRKISINKTTLQSKKIILQPSTIEIRNSMLNFHDLYNRTGNVIWKNKYNACKKLFRKKVRQEKNHVVTKKFENSVCMPKTCWSFVKDIRMKKLIFGNINLLNDDMEVIKNPKLVSEFFNDYFTINSDSVTNDNDSLNHFLNMPLMDKSDLLSLIDSLKSKKSSGWDEISMFLLKKCKYELSDPLLHLINSVLLEGVFPDALKLSIIKPLYKKGRRDKVNNYRPVSLTSTFSKLIEKVIQINLTNYYEQNQILNDFQHGFRRGRSTVLAAAEFIHTALTKLDEGLEVAGAYLDLSKAFDSVNHNILLEKLTRDGICGRLYDLIHSYLINRFQCTEIFHDDGLEIKSYRSSRQKVQCGVPQGSILGPYLYIIYVNDFPSLSVDNNFFVCMYADDTSGLCWAGSIAETQMILKGFLEESTKYFDTNHFSVNFDKTELVLFCPNKEQNNFSISIDNHSIYSQKSCKYLGFHIDEKLTWEKHVEFVCSKLGNGIFLLRRLSYYLNSNVLKMVYFGVFFPFISYGLVLWGGTHDKHLQRVFKLQKKALRIIAKVDARTSCKDLFISNDLLTIFGLYVFQVILFVRTNCKFNFKNSELHKYDTRNKNNFAIPKRKLERTSKSPFIMGTKYYNKLPNEIKSLDGNKFKFELKKWLIKKCLYNLEK